MDGTNESGKATRSQSLYGLLALLGVLSVGGMQGGWHLMNDPSGQWLAVSPNRFTWLTTDFFLPGLFVFVFFGFTPLFLAYAIQVRLKWPLAESFLSDSGDHWAWAAAMGLATLLFIWTMALVMVVGFCTLYQVVDALMSLVILSFLLLPSVRRALN
ncbi:hypothetical protein M0L20_23185 [Spirosoma sp. RP8]|uniref:Uncharacterized protein n=1 Tax=Spirosoma liriopis TaxID=2937440 RepID=A0ABT0HRI0_9BACT|nr:hypothetical protein [Spirosoma liriopis]MCK8494792.1 hypothetical protein [Spirosoma liriopis]